jgi:hypothetical protein
MRQAIAGESLVIHTRLIVIPQRTAPPARAASVIGGFTFPSKAGLCDEAVDVLSTPRGGRLDPFRDLALERAEVLFIDGEWW